MKKYVVPRVNKKKKTSHVDHNNISLMKGNVLCLSRVGWLVKLAVYRNFSFETHRMNYSVV